MELLGINEPITIYRPQGCQFCNDTGYKGRVAVHEIMYLNDEMRQVISKEKTIEGLRNIAIQNGMHTLWESCRDYVIAGATSIQELVSLSVE